MKNIFPTTVLFVSMLIGILQGQDLENPTCEIICKSPLNSSDSSFAMVDITIDTIDDELDDIILNVMEKEHIPGLAASIVKQGEVVWSKGYGFASLNPPVPVTEDTVFLLASVSKTVTGVALMQLYDEGRFDLHEPVNNYLPFQIIHPQYPKTDITFHMLLTHTSGIKDNWNIMPTYPGDPPILLGQYLQDYLCEGGAIYHPNANFYSWQPGTKYQYSNIGVALVGFLVEVISGMPSFEDYCREYLFNPLGMDETSWFLENLDPSNIAKPYKWNGLKYIPYEHYNTCYYPASCLRTSVFQLSQFLLTFMENRDQIDFPEELHILENNTAILMTRPQIPDINPNVGLIWHNYNYEGETYWFHNGSFYGVRTEMLFRMVDKTGVIVLCNKRPANLFNVYSALFGYSDKL
jgi:CubicO group peptidase (beta-lactamase class C family)